MNQHINVNRTISSANAGVDGVMLATTNIYNNVGLVVQIISQDGSSEVYAYNELNERVANIRIGAGQTLDFDPQSFILDTVIAIDKYLINLTTENTESTEGEWWKNVASISYRPGENALTTSVQRVQLTGLTLENNSRMMSTDADGNTTVVTESLNPGIVAKTAVSVDTTFGTTNIAHFVAGYEICSTNSLGTVTAHLYDGFARRIKTTNTANDRELKSVTSYHDDGSVATVGEITPTGTNTTSYSMRQPVIGEPGAYTITVTDSQGHQTVNYYSGDGELYRSEGATYPVAYAKNAAGQMAQLHTWRDETGNPDITLWYYDLFTGAVTNKLYADGKGTAYTYLPDGRIATRKWARGTLTTTYGCIDTATGSIRTTEYSDATPKVTNTFSLAGQLISVLDGTGTTTFGYDPKGRQTAETNALAIITRSYDIFGRYSQCVLDPAYPGYPCLIIQYGYDIYNRLDSVTAIIGTETNTFTYSYIPGTTLISGYTALTSSTPSTILTVSKTYESYRNLITTITNSVGSGPSVVSSFNYDNDTTGKRTARSDYYNGSAITNTFDFNARGETTNAVMNSNAYSYNFDGIGNRLQSTVDSGQSTVTNTYIANQLNQYTSVSSVPSVVNPVHDFDGNLTFDGSLWHHSWNAENRLITSSNEVTGVYITYAYDYQNRRSSMTTLTPDPFSSLTTKYIWDGWNIAAEIIIDEITPSTNITYYTWGLDLSGSLQGAGGVGGLLCETKTTPFSTNSYYALADANGNITEYVDGTRTTVAHGEHSAFGETELSGSMKDEFTHWFSSKPLDPETGLVQYQLRPYSPKLGTFLPRDPIEEQGAPRLYGFAGNNGVNLWDRLGLVTFEQINKIAAQLGILPIKTDHSNASKTIVAIQISLGFLNPDGDFGPASVEKYENWAIANGKTPVSLLDSKTAKQVLSWIVKYWPSKHQCAPKCPVYYGEFLALIHYESRDKSTKRGGYTYFNAVGGPYASQEQSKLIATSATGLAQLTWDTATRQIAYDGEKSIDFSLNLMFNDALGFNCNFEPIKNKQILYRALNRWEAWRTFNSPIKTKGQQINDLIQKKYKGNASIISETELNTILGI